MELIAYQKQLQALADKCDYYSMHIDAPPMGWSDGGIVDQGVEVLEDLCQQMNEVWGLTYETDFPEKLNFVRQMIAKDLQELIGRIQDDFLPLVRRRVSDLSYDNPYIWTDALLKSLPVLSGMINRKVFTNSLKDYSKGIENWFKLNGRYSQQDNKKTPSRWSEEVIQVAKKSKANGSTAKEIADHLNNIFRPKKKYTDGAVRTALCRKH